MEKFCYDYTHEITYKRIKSPKFNFSKVNNDGVSISNGEYIVFLNDDTKVITSDWIENLLEHCQRKEVGAVGAKLLYPNDRVQHAGTILGIQHHAGNYGNIYKDDPGYFSFAKIVRNCSAVTAACMMIKKDFFKEIGGFDESLAKAWQDVNLCIRIIQSNKLVVYTPFSLLYHYEGKTRGAIDTTEEEINARKRFRQKHSELIRKGDPYYNSNLSNIIPFQISKNYPKPIRILADLYELREDLKREFPNDQKSGFKSMIDWAATHGIVADANSELLVHYKKYYLNHCSNGAKKLAEKIYRYTNSNKLQESFPEVKEGQFKKYLKACSI